MMQLKERPSELLTPLICSTIENSGGKDLAGHSSIQHSAKCEVLKLEAFVDIEVQSDFEHSEFFHLH